MMASFAHLSREERLGLGIAAVAHVALVAALVWQVRDEPTALPIPERMTVSLADEVSTTATSPDQEQAAAAAAPEPAPLPAPAPSVAARDEVQPAPRPTRASVTRPTPTPSPAATRRPDARPTTPPRPRPSPSRSGGADDFERAFRDGTPNPRATGRSDNPPAAFGEAERASLEQAINRQLKPHWSAPQGVDAERLVTVLAWELNADGTLKGAPRVVSQSGITDSNRPQAALHAERAIRAVQLAAPFELPPQFYDKWKRISTWRFDRRL